MNKELLLISTFIAISCLQISAQTTPYFQQTVDHNIHVQLNDVDHELDAEIWTQYLNNSPYELDYLWYHVWPNAYSSAKSALAKQQFREGDLFLFYAMARDLGGMDGLDFKINGESAHWEFHNEHPDIVKVYLNTSLKPGESIEINTPFKVRIPSGKISRLGHIEQSYQITQWYPKPAVYDRDGWHEMPYLDQGEFYSEFGTFDVHITLPSNYTIGATGDMPVSESNNNAEELERLEKLDHDTRAYFKEKDISGESNTSTNEFPESSETLKTLHYHQERIHDFAWFADKRFKVLKDSTTLPHSYRQVTTWAMFTPNEEDLWREAPDYIGAATYYYSLWNGDYPYNQVTAIDGTISAGGGMEYPNVTVIGESGSEFALNVVIAHEVGHNWFYGILGSNERTNAWMDEGLTTFCQFLAEREWEEKYPSRRGMPPSIASYMKRDDEMPIMTNSESLRYFGSNAYAKPAVALNILRESVLGRENFDYAFKEYANRWKFKRPTPADFFRTMEDASGVDLDWFWTGWFYTTEHVDVGIRGVKLYQMDTKDPDVEKPRERAEREEEDAKLLTNQRNRGVKRYTDQYPDLLDFYNRNGEYDITKTDRDDFQEFLKKLEDHEREILESNRYFYQIEMTNEGGLVMPVVLRVVYDDGDVKVMRLPAELWKRDSRKTSKLLVSTKKVVSIELDPNLEIADADRSNNDWPARPEELRFTLEKDEKKNLMQRLKEEREKGEKEKK